MTDQKQALTKPPTCYLWAYGLFVAFFALPVVILIIDHFLWEHFYLGLRMGSLLFYWELIYLGLPSLILSIVLCMFAGSRNEHPRPSQFVKITVIAVVINALLILLALS